MIRRVVLASVLTIAVLGAGLVACSDDDGATTDETLPAAEAGAAQPGTTGTTLPTPVPEASTPTEDGETAPDDEGEAVPSLPAPVPAPDVLGVPGEFGVAYPGGTTCADVDALFGSGALQPDALDAVTGDDGIWLAVDAAGVAADVVFGPPSSESRLVTIRGGALVSSGPPSVAQSPALTPEESYAITDVAGDVVTACLVGPVVV